MRILSKTRSSLAITALLAVMGAPCARSQAFDVSGRVVVARQMGHTHAASVSSADVVVWLTPTQKDWTPPAPRNAQGYTLIQKDKMFTPHLLVVPTGSSVEFPNLDPFFHNVFSLFNGKRFDLGLYEAHTRRTVRFDREGISYIFCNIHPEMGAVVITLSTPYYGVSKQDGTVTLHNVPSGSYRLSVWAENVPDDQLNALSRSIVITSEKTQLGTLHLAATGDVMHDHANKFGERYAPASKDSY
jgi:plastocyanin